MKQKAVLEMEARQRAFWERQKAFSFQPRSSQKSFVIDTPPPTVSGALHAGHVFSYTHTDIIARFQRMSGRNVYYPLGFDDNGLPTEKRVQRLFNIRCQPLLQYDPAFAATPAAALAAAAAPKAAKRPALPRPASRRNFAELCARQALEDEEKYKALFSALGLSVDWGLSYRTISPEIQKLAQLSFLDLYNKGIALDVLSPVYWDTQFQTAVAQADIEFREKEGFYFDLRFSFTAPSKESVAISTSRPELLPACIALAAHPDDSRYQKLFFKTAVTPLFRKEVPFLPSLHADPQKGSGALMICAFGDMEDAAFWKKHQLPAPQIIDESGCLKEVSFKDPPFQSQDPGAAARFYAPLRGSRLAKAREEIAALLQSAGALMAPPQKRVQQVKHYEKGDFPLEILLKRQWHVSILDHKEELLRYGRKVEWTPPSMRKRYEQWVAGLNQNWCVSRQRFYGVPFPLWRHADSKGGADYSRKPILPPPESALPIDPLRQPPPGFSEAQRGKPAGFVGESSVMDTWMVSSMTPFIPRGAFKGRSFLDDLPDEDGRKAAAAAALFPADLRPQGHEIIRTWAFYSIAKAFLHEKSIPFRRMALSGWVMRGKRLKMSKSKGASMDPQKLLEEYSADAVRYWAGRARLGQDTVFDENAFKTGKRLQTKLFNSAKFVFLQMGEGAFKGFSPSLLTAPIDRAWALQLLCAYEKASLSLAGFSHAEALEEAERIFFLFCDHYIELVKGRVYQSEGEAALSGKAALDLSLYACLKLFAPYMPYITEEIWAKRYQSESLSIHNAPWRGEAFEALAKELLSSLGRKAAAEPAESAAPRLELLEGARSAEPLWPLAQQLLSLIRRQKTERGKSLRASLKSLKIKTPEADFPNLALFKEDIARAANAPLSAIHFEASAAREVLLEFGAEGAEGA